MADLCEKLTLGDLLDLQDWMRSEFGLGDEREVLVEVSLSARSARRDNRSLRGVLRLECDIVTTLGEVDEALLKSRGGS